MPKKPAIFSAAIVLFISGTSVFATGKASLLYQVWGSWGASQLGNAIAGAGDVNGDGKRDFIVGDPFGAFSPAWYGGSASVYSGADGSLLFETGGTADGGLLGYSVAGAGDINGDGKADVIVGAAGGDFTPEGANLPGSVFIFSVLDSIPLIQKDGENPGDQFGTKVIGGYDITGDGIPDFVVSAWLADSGNVTNAGAVYAYSGSDGSLLYKKYGEVSTGGFGLSLAFIGDLNGDGQAEFAVGAPFANPGGRINAGSVFLYSGATGNLLYSMDGTWDSARFGSDVSRTEDLDGDQTLDMLVCAPGFYDGSVYGQAFAFSGTTGRLLFEFTADKAGTEFGTSIVGIGDVNTDGVPDILVGAPYDSVGFHASGTGSAFIYSGKDGSLLLKLKPGKNDFIFGFGHEAADAGDLNH
ncbi:MAG: integrin alpha, partial [Limisphaerales bacterium]